MKKIVILTKHFSINKESQWLIDDLVESFIKMGHTVYVFHFNMNSEGGYLKSNVNKNLFVYRYSYRKIINSNKKIIRKINIFYSYILMQLKFRKQIKKMDVDFVVSYSAFFIFSGIIGLLKKRNPVLKSVGILWDFYPIHFQEIGHIKSKLLSRVMYKIENNELENFDKICFMTDEYLQFFKKYHPNIKGYRSEIIYIWRKFESQALSSHDGLEVGTDYNRGGKLRLIFGGQLSKGRGLNYLLDSAKYLLLRGIDVEILIVGSGDLFLQIKSRIVKEKIVNVRLIDRVTRKQYLNLVRRSDIGVIVTDPFVKSPSFPSKIIDYMNEKKPVISCTSIYSSYDDLIEYKIKCGVSCHSNDVKNFAYCIGRYLYNKDMLDIKGENGFNFMVNNMNVNHVSRKILEF